MINMKVVIFIKILESYNREMNKLIDLSCDLVKRGDEFISTHGPLKFFNTASALLAEAKLHEAFQLEDLIKASFSDNFNQNQNYGSFQFSDLPVTIAMGEHCFLDLYFWRRRPTTIHNHHFTGSFQCLEGINVDLEFEYVKEKSLGLYHDLGQLRLRHSRTLVKGDIAPIDLLDKFIHQNHHQAELTINACFRTPDIGEINLSNYTYSGLRNEQHPYVLDRISRLLSFINVGDFDVKSLNLTSDDAINFLIRTYKSDSKNKKMLEVRSYMKSLVEQDIDHLLDVHELRMNELEEQYY